MKVVVAMSGGVDSSVVAGLLVEQGHEVVGVHMKLHAGAPSGSASKTCCGLDDALDARRVADRLGIDFYVMNLQEAFQKAVVDDLVENYAAGATPSPCIRCNGVLKFRMLLARARALGASHLATGHYARIEGGALRAARDPDKDQSYFLFPMRREALDQALFPLGDLTKGEVRAHAARMGLVTADKPESQELCFVPDGDHARLIREARPDLDGAGDIVDERGRVLGRHDGYFKYTVGQRRGLGVALGVPAYVLRVEADTRRVVVTTDAGHVGSPGLVARGWTWHDRPDPSRLVQARIRHRGALIPCHVGPGDEAVVAFHEPAWAVAPGQAVVVYDGDRVLGGGWIARSLDAAAVAAEARP